MRLDAARQGDADAFGALVEPYRRELLTHCYRILGSLEDAEDGVQDTFLRAWRRLETFEGRSSIRAWLYKIATNACLDMLGRRKRRALPPDLHPASNPQAELGQPILEPVWLEPFPDELLAPVEGSPEARYEARESITLAFLGAIQALPPRQRCALILGDVLDWRAAEVAGALDTSESAANSLLHRARSAMRKTYHPASRDQLSTASQDPHTESLLQRYLRAWETANVDEIVELLTEDAKFPMPPLPIWFQGRPAIREFIAATILSGEARGRWRLLPLSANARPGFAFYQLNPETNKYRAYAIQVLSFEGDLLSDVTTFGFPALFRYFGLAEELEGLGEAFHE